LRCGRLEGDTSQTVRRSGQFVQPPELLRRNGSCGLRPEAVRLLRMSRRATVAIRGWTRKPSQRSPGSPDAGGRISCEENVMNQKDLRRYVLCTLVIGFPALGGMTVGSCARRPFDPVGRFEDRVRGHRARPRRGVCADEEGYVVWSH
jgi:hypothetical protein